MCLNILKQDLTLKDYFKNCTYFADFINGVLYNGRQVISASDLELEDTDVSAVDDDNVTALERRRDIAMRCKEKGKEVIIGIENQSTVDRDMAIRILIYDAFKYNQQLKNKKKDNRKILPMYTIVLYSGDEKWNVSESLIESLDIPEDFKEFVNDWKYKIIDIRDIDESCFQVKENRLLFRCAKIILEKGNKPESMEEMILPKDVALVVASIVKSEELYNYIKIQEREEIHMCRSLDELKQRGIEEGLLQGEMIGMEKGKMLGIQEGEMNRLIKTLIQQLTLKLGYISKELILEIKKSDENKLNELVIRIFDVNNEEDIYKILN